MTTATSSDDGGDLVLIVEDDEDSRFVYGAVLSSHGFQVATARSGDDGLRMARERRPCAILMDVSIPAMDGWTVTEHLKGDPETADIPIVIITAHAFPEDVRRAEAVRCDGFLTKPCDPMHVLEEILRLVSA